MDLTDTIQPNSDQLDATDLLTGPRTFTIQGVSKGNAEQPVNIQFTEFPRPWRPGKSMRRVLVASWGADASAYVGRRVRLYCDPDVVFGGLAVGGTRIAALSHIDKPKKVPLLVSRGKSAIFTVQPLPDAPAPAQESPLAGLLKELHAGMTALGITERDEYLAFISQAIDRDILSTKDLTADEATKAIAFIKAEQEKDAEPTLPEATP
jgi:hypothetical protein